MTTSPSDTSCGIRFSPSSSQRPGPTATTVPSCGFSLAVSGMTRPDAVVVSASLACTRILSSSGLMFTLATIGALFRSSGCIALVGIGMRPCPRAVVAGAGRGCGRLPPSTLYTRVLALKSHPCLSPVANAEVAEVCGDQRVEQVGSLPLQEVACTRKHHRTGSVGESDLACGQEVGSDDVVVHA